MYVIAEDDVPAAITVELAKSHLRVTHSQEDDLIESYAHAATQFVEAYSGLRLVEREVLLQATLWDGRWRLPKCTKQILSASFDGVDRDDASIVAGMLRFSNNNGICVPGAAEIRLRVGVAAERGTLSAQYRGPVLAAVGHLYTSREGQDFPAGIYAAVRALPGGGIRL